MIDYPGEVDIDIGFSKADELRIKVLSSDFDFYLWDSPSLQDSIHTILSLVGAPYTPPRWAFGYQQCRYSYPDEKIGSGGG